MQIQNIQRYIIWGALAAVAYLLLIQWEKDYGKAATNQKQLEQNISSEQSFQEDKLQLNNNENSTAKGDDLPSVELTETPTTNPKPIKNSNAFVSIKSNVLELKVDLLGGDIVEVKLPEHAIDIEHPNQSLKLLQNDNERVYVAQSGLVGKNGPDSNKQGRPIYSANQESYALASGEKQLNVELQFTDSNGVNITKVFELEKDSYLVNVSYKINNQSSDTWSANLFAQIKRDNTIDPLADTSLFAMKPFLGTAYWSQEKKYNKISISDTEEEPVKISHQAGWIAFVQHYFISAWIAPTELKNTFTTRVNKQGENILGFTTNAKTIAPGESDQFTYGFYAGPKDQTILETISEGLELTVDYSWLWMIAQLLYSVLIFIQGYVINWGWSIVLLTCFIKLLFFPLNQYAFKSMANMRKLQPKMQRLKEQYGDDRQKLSQATMEMYRKEKINPLGSCLPMLLQMPVFIALYWVLSESVEIRHAPFMLWIEDLSIKDPYFILPALMQ